VFVPHSARLFLAINILLNLEYIFIGISVVDFESFGDLHVQVIGLGFSLSVRQDIVNLLGVLLGVGVFVVAIMTRSKHTTSLQTRKEHRVII
jgi:hypothetical protein